MRYAILIGAGAAVVIVGVVLFAAGHASLGDHEDEGGMPASLSFSADERNYAIGLTGAGVPDGLASGVRCVVRRSDGSSKTLRRQGGGSRTVGSFDATTGLTRVRCEWANRPPGRPVLAFVAQEHNGLRTFAVLVIALGAMALGTGVWPFARAGLSGA